jgi:DNA topoisomerase-1
MNLIIVESPTKARTLAGFLGGDYRVIATMGHIKDLPKSKLGVEIENNFCPSYVEIKKKGDVVKEVKKAAKEAAVVYIATDPDREGEAIAAHVQQILSDSILSKNKKARASRYPNISVSRISFHEITKEAVEQAIANPRGIDDNLVDAQIARRVLDRLVGYKLSPLLWKKVRRGLSAGRVQTVAVRLIVEKEQEISAFKPKEYWEIFCQVKSSKLKVQSEFTVQLISVKDGSAAGRKIKITDKNQADEVVAELKKASYKVLNIKKREVVKNPYPPFTTSTLTQAASRLFGWSAKRTMSIAQKLYEEGLITYHRTDSLNMAGVAVEKVRKYIQKQYGDKYLPPRARFYKTSSKVAQEAHEAIRPTDVNTEYRIQNTEYGGDSKKLYDLIWRCFVACQMAAAIYDETIIDVAAEYSSVYVLRASGQIMKFDGWKKLYIPTSGVALDSPEVNSLPEVHKDEPLQLIEVLSEQKFTQPPARYTEASLIKTLEKLGIGRPSTYAPIISTIQIRNYVEKREGKFFPTTIGLAVNDFLIPNFPGVFEYGFTAKMEEEFDNIAEGKVKRERVLKDFWDPFDKELVKVEKSSKRVKIETEKIGRKCPECKKGDLVIRLGRFGKFISCSRFPDCKYTEKYLEKTGVKCPKCKEGDVIIKKTGKGRKFFGCSRYPDCKWASWRKPQLTKLESGNKINYKDEKPKIKST